MKQKHCKNRHIRAIVILILAVITIALIWQPIYKNVFLKTAYPQKYTQYVEEYAKATDLDESLVYAVMKNESSFNPEAQSGVGAKGLMQITPETFDWAMNKLSEDGKYTESDLFTPEVNVRYGTYILSNLLKEFDNEKTALAAYHAGRTNVKKWLADERYSKDGKTLYDIPFKDTKIYVERVEKAKKIYRELYS